MTPVTKPQSQVPDVLTDLRRLLAEVYGVEAEEITEDSDLMDDIGWSNNPEEFAMFLRRMNTHFDVHITRELMMEEMCQSVGDLADLIESEQLG